jgi:predicted O-linked N-acetylglucosamine transferase (SPINDLY family)
MAKKKKKIKPRRTAISDFSVQNSNPTEFPSYYKWLANLPDWLKKICSLVKCKCIAQAKKLLIEEEIQKNLANLKDNEAGIKFYAMYTVAVLFEETDQYERAAQYYTDMINTFKGIPNTKELSLLYFKTGIMNIKSGQCIQAIENFSKAKELDPDNINIWNNYSGAIMKMGRLEEAMDILREALAVNPQYREGYSNLLLDYNYLPDAKASEIFEESKKWAQIQAPTTLAFTDHDNSLDPHRKLRIGYISPDFRNHSVTFYFESLLDGHDRNKFEIYGYGNTEKPDESSERLIDKFDFYRDINKVGDQ